MRRVKIMKVAAVVQAPLIVIMAVMIFGYPHLLFGNPVCPMTNVTTLVNTTTNRTTALVAPSLATDVLVLNTRRVFNAPLVINSSGREDRDILFEFGEETEVAYSCSLTWKNEHYIFGGDARKTQISRLVKCQLMSVGHLPFNHHWGACATVVDKKLYLCFNYMYGDTLYGDDDHDKCRVATSPTGVFDEIPRSKHSHGGTRIAASDGKPRGDCLESYFRSHSRIG